MQSEREQTALHMPEGMHWGDFHHAQKNEKQLQTQTSRVIFYAHICFYKKDWKTKFVVRLLALHKHQGGFKGVCNVEIY